ncbi:MAG TPA: hypothetical protein PKA64_12560 [Myxococcota bacterium]|nr:hypothetical protein [Myxococcota bacterium]
MRSLVGLALLCSLPALADPPPSSDVLSGVPVSIEITSHADPGRFMGDEVLMLATATIAGSSPVGGVAVVLTIDLSESTILSDVSPEDCGGDVNNDGLYDTYLDCEITGATLVIEQMAEGGFVDEVAVVFFEKNKASADLSPASGIQTFVSPAADADSDSVLDVVEVLRSMKWYTTGTFTRFAGPSVFTSINAGEHNGGTAIGLGLQASCDVLGGSAADDQRIILFTDGHNNKNPHLEDVLPCDPNIPVYAFGLGPDGECTDGSEVTFGELANHVPGTGGECYDINSVYTLPDVLGGFFTPKVTAARAILDGGTPVNLTTGVTPALPYEGFGEVDLSWLAEGLDDAHEVCFELDIEVGEESGTIGHCVTLELNEAPTLALGSALVVDEGDVVTLDLSGADDPDDDTLNTIWEVLTLDGPALAAPSEGQQAASWLALDDGSYEDTLRYAHPSSRFAIRSGSMTPCAAIQASAVSTSARPSGPPRHAPRRREIAAAYRRVPSACAFARARSKSATAPRVSPARRARQAFTMSSKFATHAKPGRANARV